MGSGESATARAAAGLQALGGLSLARRRLAGGLEPLTTALSIVAGRPVSIQSPASQSPCTGVAVTGRAG